MGWLGNLASYPTEGGWSLPSQGAGGLPEQLEGRELP